MNPAILFPNLSNAQRWELLPWCDLIGAVICRCRMEEAIQIRDNAPKNTIEFDSVPLREYSAKVDDKPLTFRVGQCPCCGDVYYMASDLYLFIKAAEQEQMAVNAAQER